MSIYSQTIIVDASFSFKICLLARVCRSAVTSYKPQRIKILFLSQSNSYIFHQSALLWQLLLEILLKLTILTVAVSSDVSVVIFAFLFRALFSRLRHSVNFRFRRNRTKMQATGLSGHYPDNSPCYSSPQFFAQSRVPV